MSTNRITHYTDCYPANIADRRREAASVLQFVDSMAAILEIRLATEWDKLPLELKRLDNWARSVVLDDLREVS